MKQANILLEYMFAFMMISAVILLLSYLAFSLVSPQIAQAKSSQLEEKAFSISDMLIKSKGIPDNWEKGNEIKAIGLAQEPYALSKEKLQRFSLLKEEFLAEIFGTESFMIRIKGSNIDIQKGIFPTEKNIAIAERHATLDDEQVKVTVAIW